MKKNITKNLIIFGTIILSLILVNKVSAYSCYGYSCVEYPGSGSYSSHYDYDEDSVNYYYDSGYYSTQSPLVYGYNPTSEQPTVVNNYYYQTAPTSSTSKTSTSSTTKTTTASNTDSTNKISSNTNSAVSTNGTGYYNGGYNYGNGMGASAYDGYYNNQGSRITALSWKGSGGFMPSSVWQWILVVILILAIIIISRLIIHKRTVVAQEAHINHAH